MRRRELLSALALAAAAGPATLRPVVAQTLTVRLAAAANDSYAETLFANDGGFFKRAGLEVETTMFTNAPAMVAAAVGGAVDVGMADVIQIGNAVNRGVPLGVIASGAIYDKNNPTTLLCLAKDSPIRSARELDGQPVAVVSLGAFGAISIQEWMKRNAGAGASAKLLEMPFAPMAAALGRGTVAAALIGEPFLSSSRDDVRVLVDPYPAIANSFYIAVSFAPREWIARNPEAARRFVRALYEAARWANSHHDDSALILSKYTKLDVERIRTMKRSLFATSRPDVRLMQPVLDIGLAYQLMTKPLAAATMIASV